MRDRQVDLVEVSAGLVVAVAVIGGLWFLLASKRRKHRPPANAAPGTVRREPLNVELGKRLRATVEEFERISIAYYLHVEAFRLLAGTDSIDRVLAKIDQQYEMVDARPVLDLREVFLSRQEFSVSDSVITRYMAEEGLSAGRGNDPQIMLEDAILERARSKAADLVKSMAGRGA